MSEEKNNENELLSKEDNPETPLNPSNADELRYGINHYNFLSL